MMRQCFLEVSNIRTFGCVRKYNFSLKNYQIFTSWILNHKNHDCNIVEKRLKGHFFMGHVVVFGGLEWYDLREKNKTIMS